jgi:hypothetical protein
MRSFALNYAGVAAVVIFLACGSTKKAGDGGATSSGGVTSPGGTGGVTTPGGAGGAGGVTSPGGAGGAGGVTTPGGAGGAGGVTTSIADAAVNPGTGGAGDFADRYASAFCQLLVRCGLSPSAAVCKADYFDSGLLNLTAIYQDIDNGTTLYDASKAGPCFDAFANGTCAQGRVIGGSQLDALCAPVLKGTVPSGGNCVVDTECAAGVCHQPACGASCCLGMCGLPATTGAACDSDTDCASSDYCNTNPYATTGRDTCQPLLAQGQPCDYSNSCQDGLDCDGSGTGTCVPYVKDGQSCSVDGPGCESLSSFCDPQSGRCRPRLVVGAACSVPSGMLSRPDGGCVFYADCVGGICVALPGPGEACAVPDGGYDSLVCRSGECTNGRCQSMGLDPPCTLASATAPDAGARD